MIVNKEIYLDTIDIEDMKKLRKWRNHPDIYQWCRQHSLINEIKHGNWYEWQATEPSVEMLIIRTATGDPVGVCGLTSIDHLHRRAEFSLYIAAHRQGKGYGYNGLRMLIDHGFRDLNLNIIWGETFEGNPAMSMFERIGFVYEGTRRQFYFKNGVYLDAHLVSITKEEFYDRESNPLLTFNLSTNLSDD